METIKGKLDPHNNPVIAKLEEAVGDLAAMWRASKDEELVKQYHLVLNCLMDMGWQASLDLEDHLPSPLMPIRYVEMQEARRKQRSQQKK